jgi:hypothetical protein
MKNNIWYAWYDYQVWLFLQMKFMTPAAMISRNDEMEKFLRHFSLNGVKQSNICRPF